MTGTHAIVFQHRLGKRDELENGEEVEINENNEQGMDMHGISNRATETARDDKVESSVFSQGHNSGRVKRASNSGYVRFGKRFSPLIEGLQGHHNIAASPADERYHQY